jgi:Zn-dependent oligopeptidase
MPPILIEKLEKIEGKENSRFVSMQYPEVLPALKLCKNSETRRKLNFAYGTRCVEQNVSILEDLISKRH